MARKEKDLQQLLTAPDFLLLCRQEASTRFPHEGLFTFSCPQNFSHLSVLLHIDFLLLILFWGESNPSSDSPAACHIWKLSVLVLSLTAEIHNEVFGMALFL